MKKKVTLLTVFVLLLSSLTMLKAADIQMEARKKVLSSELERITKEAAAKGIRPEMYATELLLERAKAKKGVPVIVEALMIAGANFNARDKGKTPLMLASEVGNKEMVAFLINTGANVNEQTPRMGMLQRGAMEFRKEAASMGESPLRKVLAQVFGGGEKVALKGGATPLMFAVVGKHPDIVKMLLDAGASKAIKDDDGKTAYDYASGAIKKLLQ